MHMRIAIDEETDELPDSAKSAAAGPGSRIGPVGICRLSRR
jgi:hypothetical protein